MCIRDSANTAGILLVHYENRNEARYSPEPVAISQDQGALIAEPALYGPDQWWNTIEGCAIAHDCAAVWTSAAPSDGPQHNYAIWDFEGRSGRQTLECFIPHESAVATTKYEIWVEHKKVTTVSVNQRSIFGWTVLAQIEAGNDSRIEIVVRDNSASPVDSAIGIDACRISFAPQA